MELKQVPIKSLKPHPKNPRIHPDSAVNKLVTSIKEFGWTNPILVSEDGFIIAGHARLKAAEKAGLEEVPAIFLPLSGKQAEMYMLADNRLQDETDWDMPLLADILEGFKDSGLDATLAGFDKLEIDELIAQLHLPEPWNPEGSEPDGMEEIVGYNLSSFWKDLPRDGGRANQYMLDLPKKKHGAPDTIKGIWSRTNSLATERIVRTYMRKGDLFYEMCSGWVTFSATAKYWGFSGKASDIWDTALAFDRKQIAKMPGAGEVEIIEADCRGTGEPDNTYDFLHSNPPFFSLEEYSDNKADLSGLGSYDKWLLAMVDMAKEAERILKPGGLANFVLNDYREKSYLVNMHADFLSVVLKGTNLKMWDMVVSEVVSQRLRFRKMEYKNRHTVKCHEYIMTFKKP